ncbi:hypothetical protein LOK49_LG13G00200 [Camellia lanceoleosa]|uniref:Uncharacterized protein n=1 Tax=Camellia lanceoleosa TaxID=1840588 RepID=A0ACC0FNR5_9ERIC|nr:hypothetical protein LOK49_LG13G00200 [Camellia lanceoleosa]
MGSSTLEENDENVSDGDSKPPNLVVSSGPFNANGDPKDQKGGNSANTALRSSILDYEEICRRENQMIKQALLADLDCEQWRAEKNVDCDELNGVSLTANNSSLNESQYVVFLKLGEACGTVYGNLATVFVVQGDLVQAQRFVMQALSIIPNSPEAIVTAIYVDLMIGKTQEALTKLK